MLELILIGGSFAFAAAMQPGPLQAFLLARVAADGWRRTLPAALAPVISDGPIAVFVLLVLHNVARGFESTLRGIGGLVFAFFAARALSDWWNAGEESENSSQSAPRTLAQAVAVNIVNPGPYLGWSLVLGPLTLEAWARSPVHAIALVGSFYVVMVTSLSLFILLLGTTSFLGYRGRQTLLLVSAFALAGISVYSLWSALG
jgi:threonine/homoserine/homoserine lactone efflux protein